MGQRLAIAGDSFPFLSRLILNISNRCIEALGFRGKLASLLQGLESGRKIPLSPLKVGQTSTEVQVTGAAPQIDLTSSAVSGQVESETVRSAEMVEMAAACTGLLTRPPDVDLLEGLSAHDLN